jgi:hypothetical protein
MPSARAGVLAVTHHHTVTPTKVGVHVSFDLLNVGTLRPKSRMWKLAWVPAFHAEHGCAMTPACRVVAL